MSRSLATIVTVLALLITACSGGDGDTATTAGPDPDPADETGTANGNAEGGETAGPDETDIPAVEVINVRTGDTIDLRSFAPSDTPLLFWFWAPH